MRSLRSWLILGVSLTAVIPLAIALYVMSLRIQETVQRQANERLTSATAVLEEQIGSEATRIADKVRILSRDPALRRLYLVGASRRELDDHLAQQRFLLDLDFLRVSDTSDAVVGDAALAVGVRLDGTDQPARNRNQLQPAGVAGTRRLDDRPALALFSDSPILYQNQTTGFLRGGIVIDEGYLDRLKRTSGLELVLRDSVGRVAATLQFADTSSRTPVGFVGRSVPIGGSSGQTTLTALASTRPAEQTINALRTTSALLGVLAVLLAIGLAVLWSAQISRPVERLAEFSERVARGEWDEPLAVKSFRELETLVTALERMRSDLHGYRRRLVASERHAAWSTMARMVAHEVKNPLTPIAVSIADLKRSFEQKRPDFPAILDQAVQTVDAEVRSLKHMLDEFATLGSIPEPQFARARVSELLADLRTLYGGELESGRLALADLKGEPVFWGDRAQIRQAVINLVKNALEAVDDAGRVRVSSWTEDHRVRIAVTDNGPGLDSESRANLFVPAFSTKGQGRGLGLAIVDRIVSDHGGTIEVDSNPGRGTTIRLVLPVERGA
jgi:two-component system, NtrC family, nitrogen regulation sensor histidine kinase NtrY